MPSLHPDLLRVHFSIDDRGEGEIFQKRRGHHTLLKWWGAIFLRVFGMTRYDAQSIVGYDTFLFGEETIRQMVRGEKLLDIGAGSGTVTEHFAPYFQEVFFTETSEKFRQMLEKKGYKKWDGTRCDTVTIFNVFDVCDRPEEVIKMAREAVTRGGQIIISLPFPILLRSHDHNIAKTNDLSKLDNTSFEASINALYEQKLQHWGLEVTGFTETKYIVHLGDEKKPITYSNAVFVCKCV